MHDSSIAHTLSLLLWSLAVVQGGCRKGFELSHEQVGNAEVAVLVVDEPKSASLPPVQVYPGKEKKFVRVALHARGAGKLKETDVFLVGGSGTRAEAARGWGDSRLEPTFRILDYWFTLPVAEPPAALELKGERIPVTTGKDVWPWRVEIGKLAITEELLVSDTAGERRVKARDDEAFVVLEATFEPLFALPSALPKADGGERGPLRIYVESPAPDTSVQLRYLRWVGDGNENGIGAVAAVGNAAFFAGESMHSAAIGSTEPKIVCRLASRLKQVELAKIKQLAFGPLRISIPRT